MARAKAWAHNLMRAITLHKRLNCLSYRSDCPQRAKSYLREKSMPLYCVYRSQPEMSLGWPKTVSCMAEDDDVSDGRR